MFRENKLIESLLEIFMYYTPPQSILMELQLLTSLTSDCLNIRRIKPNTWFNVWLAYINFLYQQSKIITASQKCRAVTFQTVNSTKVVCIVICYCILETSVANSVNSDLTAPYWD